MESPSLQTESSASRPGQASEPWAWPLYLFDHRYRLIVVRSAEGRWSGARPDVVPPFSHDRKGLAVLVQAIEEDFGFPGPWAVKAFPDKGTGGGGIILARTEAPDLPLDASARAVFPLEVLSRWAGEDPSKLAENLYRDLPLIYRHAIEIPYLDFQRYDFVYKFRSEKERNTAIYALDDRSKDLYQSKLCEVIKETRRKKENSSSIPAEVDFGPIKYYLPSHFGFCLGVQNAIERAYETLAKHPDQRVFMVSELIHNPFVNEDLRERGLKYLQSDKGEPALNEDSGRPYWEELEANDIVVIPAFGATNEDKVRLIEKGIPLNEYDATCMLVEKVWKAAKRFGESGFSVIIHGKREHEETKATFSNSAHFAPSLVIRNQVEAEKVGAIILEPDPERKRALFEEAGFRHSSGFCPEKDLERISIVNQTTLLRNETLGIIRYFESVMEQKHGKHRVRDFVNGKSRGDTLCYATQVNQDALEKTLEYEMDAAIVAGGKNSSNTFQLFRLCEREYGERAHYIQSERNILSKELVEHYIFPQDPTDRKQGKQEVRPFLQAKPEGPYRILLTGGASCPDGIIQQIINKINGFFDPSTLRPLEDILDEVRSTQPEPG